MTTGGRPIDGVDAHGLWLDVATLAAVVEHAERDYPSEACGIIAGRPHAPGLERVCPLRNVQDRYHARDPVRYPRTSREAFRVDELERLRLLEQLDGDGLVERVVYHSHCDAGAYFSPEDRALAVLEGIELLPGVVHLVVSVREGCARDAAAFAYDPATSRFLEVRVPIVRALEGWPDLRGRAALGRPPMPSLVRCLATRAEAEWAQARATHAHEVSAALVLELRRLALGYWSPSLGFGDGGPPPGELAEVGAPGRGLALLLREGRPVAALRVPGGGPRRAEALVFDAALEPDDVDPLDVRAELARRGSDRATAVRDGPGHVVVLDARGRVVATSALGAHPVDAVCARLVAALGATLDPGGR